MRIVTEVSNEITLEDAIDRELVIVGIDNYSRGFLVSISQFTGARLVLLDTPSNGYSHAEESSPKEYLKRMARDFEFQAFTTFREAFKWLDSQGALA